jgi:hypothetical protein
MATRNELFSEALEELVESIESLYDDDSDYYHNKRLGLSEYDFPERKQNDAGEWIFS